MTFEIDKNNALTKEDKSLKGSWDEKILSLCSAINSKKDFFTSSSCSGRIVLIKTSDSHKKQDTAWLFTSHKEVSYKDIEPSLEGLPEETVIFRYEPFILHIVCRDLQSADSLLSVINGCHYYIP